MTEKPVLHLLRPSCFNHRHDSEEAIMQERHPFPHRGITCRLTTRPKSADGAAGRDCDSRNFRRT
jgi:hypothetical protein